MKRKNILALFLTSMMLLGIAGCTNDKNNNDSGKQVTEKKEVVINWPIGADPKMLYPALASDGESGFVIDLVFEGLMRYEPDGKVVPGIASEFKAEDGGKTYVFKIRPNLKFHDGTPVDAEAVKWNFDRQIGSNAKPDMPYAKEIFGNVEKVEVVDPLTVKIFLKTADATFRTYLAQRIGTGIASPTAWKKDPEGFKRNPVGSGPYKFKEWIPEQYVVLEPNKEYYGGAPKNDKLVYKIIKESAVRTSELIAGSVDVLTNVDINDIARLKTEGITVDSKPGNNINYVAFLNKKPFNDKRVRQAIWMAIDREALVKGLYGDNAVVAKSLIPPTMLGGKGDFKTYPYDPEKAKTLLAEAGYPNGLSFRLLAYNITKGYNPVAERLAVALQNELAKVNVKVEITVKPWAEFLKDMYAENTDGYDAIMAGWGAATNDTSYMTQLLESKNGGTGPNHSDYNNPEFDKLIEEARTTVDTAKQEALYIKAAQIINDDVPWLIISHGKDYWAYRPNVKAKGYLGVWGNWADKITKD